MTFPPDTLIPLLTRESVTLLDNHNLDALWRNCGVRKLATRRTFGWESSDATRGQGEWVTGWRVQATFTGKGGWPSPSCSTAFAWKG